MADLARAERSFSGYPFGTPLPAPGLRTGNPAYCQRWGECIYLDGQGVEHSPDFEGFLAIKSIKVGRRPVAALGIGKARRQAEVISQVERFLEGAQIGCSAGREPVCDASLGEGWIRLFFDGRRNLREVRIDAYHFT